MNKMRCPDKTCMMSGMVRIYNASVGEDHVYRNMICDACNTKFDSIEIPQDLFRKMRHMSWLAGSLLDLSGFDGELDETPRKAPIPPSLEDLLKGESPKKKGGKGKKKGKLKRLCDYCSATIKGLNSDTDDSDKACPLYFCPPNEETHDSGCRVKWEAEEEPEFNG